jgi:hypothetical protein
MNVAVLWDAASVVSQKLTEVSEILPLSSP